MDEGEAAAKVDAIISITSHTAAAVEEAEEVCAARAVEVCRDAIVADRDAMVATASADAAKACQCDHVDRIGPFSSRKRPSIQIDAVVPGTGVAVEAAAAANKSHCSASTYDSIPCEVDSPFRGSRAQRAGDEPHLVGNHTPNRTRSCHIEAIVSARAGAAINIRSENRRRSDGRIHIEAVVAGAGATTGEVGKLDECIDRREVAAHIHAIAAANTCSACAVEEGDLCAAGCKSRGVDHHAMVGSSNSCAADPRQRRAASGKEGRAVDVEAVVARDVAAIEAATCPAHLYGGRRHYASAVDAIFATACAQRAGSNE